MIVEDANEHVKDKKWSPEGMLNPVLESIDQFGNFTEMYYNISSLDIVTGGIGQEDLRI
jgi:hypothetical protein